MAGPINGLGSLAQAPIANTFQPGQQAQNQRTTEVNNQGGSSSEAPNVAQASQEGVQQVQEASNDQDNVVQGQGQEFAADTTTGNSEDELGERGSLVDIAV